MSDQNPEDLNKLDGHSAPAQPDDLHNLFVTPEEEDPLAAMRDDPNYGALIKELEYIAAEARRLFEPAADTPSDEVWNKIQKELGKPEDA